MPDSLSKPLFFHAVTTPQRIHRFVTEWESRDVRLPARLADKQENTMSREAAEHHVKAAEHHEHASRHHREAAEHHESGDHQLAAHHAHVAQGHLHHATHHAAEAAKAHAEHHGQQAKAAGR